MEKLILNFFILFALTTTLLACKAADPALPVGIDPYTIKHDQFVTKTVDTLEGSGIVAFDSLIPSPSVAFRLQGSLSALTGSSITVILYSANPSLSAASGFEITLASQYGNLHGSLRSSGGVISTIQPSRFSLYFPSSLDLTIQIRNSISGSRIAIWKSEFPAQSIASVDVDSANSGHVSPVLGFGGSTGSIYGLRMNNAKVTGALLTTPYFQF